MKKRITTLSALLLGTTAFAAGPQVSGSVAGKFTYRDPGIGRLKNTMSVPSGSLVLSQEVGNYGVLVDIPFSSGTNTFTIADANTQAFISGKFDNGLSMKAGQFDSIFGLEPKSEFDKTFAQGSAVAAHNPVTHRGALFHYDMSDMLGIDFMLYNPTTTLSAAGGDLPDNNPSQGLNFNAKMDTFNLNVGMAHGRVLKKDRWMIFTNAKADFNPYWLNLEFNYGKDNDVIVAASTKPKILTGAELGYVMSETMNVATRFEWLSHNKTKRMRWTTGPQYKLAKNVKFKADYTWDNMNSDYDEGTGMDGRFALGTKGGKSYSDHIVAAAVVYAF